MKRLPVFLSVLVMAAGLAGAPIAAARAQDGDGLIDNFDDWSAFSTTEDGKPVCYIASVPTKEEGDYSSRGDSYLMVVQRPTEKTFDTVSVQAGYAYKELSEVTVVIGGASFKMFTDGTWAWAYTGDDDRAMVRAMVRGIDMVVKGTSGRGTLTTDTYSLKGFTAAYKASRAACGL